jgi:uncharacterized surface protein with fasciclin (FAS1) repeats
MERHHKYRILILLLLLTCFGLHGCREEEHLEVFFEEEELLISDYLEEHAEKFSSLIRVLEIAGLKSTLNAYGHYTFFAPDDDAFDAFLAQQGKSSVEEFDPAYLTTLIRYHLLDIEIESAYFRDGAIQDTTYSGDYLVITFTEGGLETILVNDALITDRDIHLENGIIHGIDKVLKPLVGSIFNRLQELETFSIFSEALEITGINDTLDLVRIDLNEDIFIRSRFTVFAEPDEVYNENGITSVSDLVSRYSDTDDPADKSNGLHQFIAYHIVPGLYYLNEIDSFNYPTLAENMLINVKLENNVFLNWQQEEADGQPIEKYIAVIEEHSNQQAKNGVLHEIDNILEPHEPDPAKLIIDLTDYQGLSLGQSYTEKDLEDIPGITTENTGVQFRNSILADGETNLQTTSNTAGWMVEFDLAPILRGKYDVYLHWASHPINTGSAQGFWDGARFGDLFSFVHNKRWPGVEWKYDYNTSTYMGRLLLTVTEKHKIKFISLQNGYGNFDYLVFWPIEE